MDEEEVVGPQGLPSEHKKQVNAAILAAGKYEQAQNGHSQSKPVKCNSQSHQPHQEAILPPNCPR